MFFVQVISSLAECVARCRVHTRWPRAFLDRLPTLLQGGAQRFGSGRRCVGPATDAPCKPGTARRNNQQVTANLRAASVASLEGVGILARLCWVPGRAHFGIPSGGTAGSRHRHPRPETGDVVNDARDLARRVGPAGACFIAGLRRAQCDAVSARVVRKSAAPVPIRSCLIAPDLSRVRPQPDSNRAAQMPGRTCNRSNETVIRNRARRA